ncbi:hypothetical protein [Aliidiomarina soli]|uniref:Serine protease n=1 Tax=Aliidiomarina soli TaxID=1928574 RepID=A0A432WHM7_9GAMM|nr:hypothetical protein [Aliidiomarina soli]RUO33322.1 hypothetical protein CWE14_08900 [Aliidiomarina soli]
MNILKQNIKSNFVTFKYEGLHVGCGFIISVEREAYCITAGHVVYGSEFKELRDLQICDVKNQPIPNQTLVSDLNFSKKNDLAVYILQDFPVDALKEVKITGPIISHSLLSISYVKAEMLPEAFFIESINFSDQLNGNMCRYRVPNSTFNHFGADTHGPDAMEGISGSPGLLCTHNDSLVFHGLIDKIPNSGVNNFVDMRGLEPLKEIIENLEITPHTEFDLNQQLISFNRNIIDKETFSKWVEKWRSTPGNEKLYNNLETKLETIFGEKYIDQLPKELEKIMIGDECLKRVIQRDSTLNESYKDVKITAERDQMLKYVNSKHEAHQHYTVISNEHLEVVTSDLSEFKLKKTDLRKIAQYDVATWMAVCHLRFEKK